MQRDPNLTAMEAEILQERAGLRPARPSTVTRSACCLQLFYKKYLRANYKITPLGREQAKLWPVPGDEGEGR